MPDNEGKILLYQTDDCNVTVDVRFEDETFWLTQKVLAELFGTTVANINIHIKNIFDEGELEEGATIKDSLIVQIEGSREVSRKTRLYNLDMVIAAGYRVNSRKATRFRQWATKTLKEYIQKDSAPVEIKEIKMTRKARQAKEPEWKPEYNVVNLVRGDKPRQFKPIDPKIWLDNPCMWHYGE
jgi:hypothetical protein